MRTLPACSLSVLLGISASAALRAQCTPQWVSSGGLVGVDGPVYASCTWDPDGVGPASPVWVVGGDFHVAGNVVASHVAVFDPATNTWSALGTGVDGVVRAIIVLPTGELLVAGDIQFPAVSASGGYCLAKWDGATWSAFGPAMTLGTVSALALDGAGTLFVAGGFQTYLTPSVASYGIVQWDGATWSGVGSVTGGGVVDLAARSVGVVAVGSFSPGGTPAWVAEWNGSAWSPLGSGPSTGGIVSRVGTLSNGDVIVTGSFASMGGVPASDIARWDGAAWNAYGSAIGGSFTHTIRDLAIDANDDVYVGGLLITVPNGTPRSLWRCHNGVWSPVGGSAVEWWSADVQSVQVLPSGDLLVGGRLFGLRELPGSNVARWDGVSWHGLGAGTSGGVATLATMPDNSVVAGGFFMTIGGTAAAHVARWDGAQWLPMGTGLPWAPGPLVVRGDGHVFASPASQLAEPPFGVVEWDGSTWISHSTGWDGPVAQLMSSSQGGLFASGNFTVAAGVPAARLARYDGTSWHAVGQGLPNTAGLLATLADGRLLATYSTASGYEVRAWNGSGWSTFGAPFDRPPTLCVELANGDLLAGGAFTTVGGAPCRRVARWDGVQWSVLGTGLGSPTGSEFLRQLLVRRSGHVVALGSFQYAGAVACPWIAEWDGSAWHDLGAAPNDTVWRAIELPGGDLVVVGQFTTIGGVVARRIARWNGASWSELAGGFDRVADRLFAMPNGDFAVPGPVVAAGSIVSAGVNWLGSSCPASATSLGTACVGASAASVLASTQLPWLGDSFVARTNNVPSNAFAVLVWGLGGVQLPLASVFAAGVPGCDLLVTPDALELALPANGVVTTSLAIPVATALIGQTFRHQTVPVELGPAGEIVAVTSSNALQLTIGSW